MEHKSSLPPHLPASVAAVLLPILAEIEVALRHCVRQVSDSTYRQYKCAMERMDYHGLTPEEIGANVRKSFNLYRAALVYFTIRGLRPAFSLLIDYPPDFAVNEALQLAYRCESYVRVLREYPPGAKRGRSKWKRPDGPPVRKSKRIGFSKLPDGWQIAMIEAVKDDPECANATRVTALTGCRPAELVAGVVVEATPCGTLLFEIPGAKCTENSGQSFRRFEVKNNNLIAENLFREVVNYGQDACLLVKIVDARAYCDRLRGVSPRVLPRQKYTITPYSFRHAFSADQKKQRIPMEVRAMAMGHQSALSQRHYGRGSQAKGQMIHIERVEASQPIRHLEEAKMGWPKGVESRTVAETASARKPETPSPQCYAMIV